MPARGSAAPSVGEQLAQEALDGLTPYKVGGSNTFFSATILSSSSPRLEPQKNGMMVIHASAGSEAGFDCLVIPKRADLAAAATRMMKNMLDAPAIAGVALEDAHTAVVGNGYPALELRARYTMAQGNTYGFLKLAVAVTLDTTLLCTHDGPGFNQTLAATFAVSLPTTKAPSPSPRCPSHKSAGCC